MVANGKFFSYSWSRSSFLTVPSDTAVLHAYLLVVNVPFECLGRANFFIGHTFDLESFVECRYEDLLEMCYKPQECCKY